MKVILISGYAGSGKDTIGDVIQAELEVQGKKVLTTHFADYLKFVCCNYFDWNGQKDIPGRNLLQKIGTDVFRKKDENFWVDALCDILTVLHEEWDYVIIPDLRFPNELDRMRELGFDVTHVHVVRDNYVSHLTKEQKNHLSETAMDNIVPDYYIDNSLSYIALLSQIEEFMEDLTNE